MYGPNLNSKNLKVFLCHGSEDKPIIRKIYNRLKNEGIVPWLDEEDILAGQDWNSEIRKAVRSSDVILVCLSKKSINKSGYVQKEIKFALDIAEEKPEGSIFIIPIKLDDCETPERLSIWQWVEYSQTNWYQILMKTLVECASQKGLRTKIKNKKRPLISIILFILTICVFLLIIFFRIRNESPKQKTSSLSFHKDTPTEKVVVDTIEKSVVGNGNLNKNDTTAIVHDSLINPPIKKINNKTSVCDINNVTYSSMSMRGIYYIKFYDKEGNNFKFVAYEGAENINGTAILKGNKIFLDGNYGTGEVTLGNNCEYLTGYIQGKYERFSLNYSL